MAYCTLDDLYNDKPSELLRLFAGDEGDSDATVDSRLGAAIEKASARIDSYLCSRYPTPLENPPPSVRDLCVDIAVYYIFSRRGIDEDSAEKSVQKRYDDALKFLREISSGSASIGEILDSGSATSPESECSYRFPKSPFEGRF